MKCFFDTWCCIYQWFETIPIPSMYGIFTNIWLIFLVNVGKYSPMDAMGLSLSITSNATHEDSTKFLSSCHDYTPWRLICNVIMDVWCLVRVIFLSKWVICRFHVNLSGWFPSYLWCFLIREWIFLDVARWDPPEVAPATWLKDDLDLDLWIVSSYRLSLWSISSRNRRTSQNSGSIWNHSRVSLASLKNDFFSGAQQFLPLDHPATTVRMPSGRFRWTEAREYSFNAWRISCPSMEWWFGHTFHTHAQLEVLKLLVFFFHFCKAHGTYKTVAFNITLLVCLKTWLRWHASFNIGCT